MNRISHILMAGASALPMSICAMSAEGYESGSYDDGTERWPAVFYGPDGASETFNSPLEVPDGWHDHPSKVGDKNAKTVIPGYEEAVAAAERNADAMAAGGLSPEHGGTPVDPEAEKKLNGDGVNPSEPGIRNSGENDRDRNIQETAKAKGYVLPDIKDIDKDEIKRQLTARKVQFNANWNEQRLYDLLKDNLDKLVGSEAKPEGNQV